MGHIYAKIKILNLDMNKFIEHTLLVDTGSTYSWISKYKLAQLDIKPIDEVRIKTIEGNFIKRKIGEAIFKYNGKHATRIVVFAEKKDCEVIGVDTLEGLALEVEPVSKKLKKLKAVFAI